MMQKQEIQHAIDNWQDENYICGNFFYVFNESQEHYKYEINSFKAEWIRVKFNLIEVGDEIEQGIWYQSLSNILKNVEEINNQDLKSFKLIKKRAKLRDTYFKALLNRKL